MTTTDLIQRLPLMRKFFPKAPVGAVFFNGHLTVIITASNPKYNTHGTLVSVGRQVVQVRVEQKEEGDFPYTRARLERKVYVPSNFHIDWLLEDGFRRIA